MDECHIAIGNGSRRADAIHPPGRLIRSAAPPGANGGDWWQPQRTMNAMSPQRVSAPQSMHPGIGQAPGRHQSYPIASRAGGPTGGAFPLRTRPGFSGSEASRGPETGMAGPGPLARMQTTAADRYPLGQSMHGAGQSFRGNRQCASGTGPRNFLLQWQ